MKYILLFKQNFKYIVLLILTNLITVSIFVFSLNKQTLESVTESKVTTEAVNYFNLHENELIDEIVEVDKKTSLVSISDLGLTFEVPNDGSVKIDRDFKMMNFINFPQIKVSVIGGGVSLFTLYPYNSNSMYGEKIGANVYQTALSNMNIKTIKKAHDDGYDSFVIEDIEKIYINDHIGYKFTIHNVEKKALSFTHRKTFDINYYYIHANKNNVLVISERYDQYSYENSPTSIHTMTKLINSINFL